MTTQINDAATQARETARKPAGQFGIQNHGDSGIVTVGPLDEQSLITIPDGWKPWYRSPYMGGAYVGGFQYLNGLGGHVSRNFRDGKWRIVRQTTAEGIRPGYRTRDEAAAAEYLYTRTPSVIRADLATLRDELAGYLEQGSSEDDYGVMNRRRDIALGEKLLADNGLPLDA